MRRIALSLVLALGIIPAAVHGASGDRDRSYGANGVAYANPDFPEPISTIAIQADNKVINGGPCYVPAVGKSVFCMVRHLTDGSIDTSFGVQGRVYTVMGVADSNLRRILVLPDGKIVAIGYTDYYDPIPAEHNFYGFAAARYNPDGSLDTTFDGDGVWMNTLVGGHGALANDVVVQPDGKLVIAGTSTVTLFNFIAVRLNVDGSLDTTFGSSGISITQTGFSGGATCVALQQDGKILLGGNGTINDKYIVIRLTSNGTLDGTFNNSGKLGFVAGVTVNDHIRRVAVLPNGKIMVMGHSQEGFGGNFGSYVVVLVRINADGTLDTSFNGNGRVLSHLPGTSDSNANDFLVLPTGKIIVTGSIGLNGNLYSMSARYRTDGTLDPQYGDKGQLRDYSQFESTGVVRQSDGKIIFAGTRFFSYPGDQRAYLERVLDNGTREVDFDNDRKADVSVFRPSTGTWYLLKSTDGFAGIGFGASGDRIVPGDYDGDGRIDVAVFREGNWYLLRSSDGSFTATPFGQSGDIPVAADYDGDGKTDLAVFRQGNWYILNSSDGSFRAEQFGQVGDRPVVGNFDGDLRSDLAVFRGGFWYVNGSISGFTYKKFGLESDRPVAADYDSDGKTDFAVYRDGIWYLQQSFAGFSAVPFGIASDRPVPADYDADGRADIAVFRDGVWYELRSTTGFESVFFGSDGDVPVPAAYLP